MFVLIPIYSLLDMLLTTHSVTLPKYKSLPLSPFMMVISSHFLSMFWKSLSDAVD